MPKKVLVVEDHPQQNQDLCDLVCEAGFEPVSARSAKQAFAKLKKNRRYFGLGPNHINCILLDWNLPEMNGDLFLRQLRQKKQWVPVVFVTIYDELEKRQFSAGVQVAMAADYIAKPYQAEDILHCLDRIMTHQEGDLMVVEHRARVFAENQQRLALFDHNQRQFSDNRMAYISGQNDEEGLLYLEQLQRQAEQDYVLASADRSAQIDPKRLAFLKSRKDLIKAEVQRLNS